MTKPHQALSGVCLTLSLMAASVSAVASGPGKIEQQKMEGAIAAAKAAIKGAKSVGFEWRDSGKTVLQAEVAIAYGNVDKALYLAAKAQFQGEAGQAQAINQASAAPRFDAIIEKMNAFDQEIAAAEQARKGAAKVGFEWRDTGKMIKKARTAANSSHYDKAIKLAKKARFQGEAGQQQAKGQASAGPRF